MKVPWAVVVNGSSRERVGSIDVAKIFPCSTLSYLRPSPARIPRSSRKHSRTLPRLEDLEKRMPRLTVVLRSAAAAVTVLIDGAALGAESLGQPRWVDPGQHLVSSQCPEPEARISSITASEGLSLPGPSSGLSLKGQPSWELTEKGLR